MYKKLAFNAYMTPPTLIDINYGLWEEGVVLIYVLEASFLYAYAFLDSLLS